MTDFRSIIFTAGLTFFGFQLVKSAAATDAVVVCPVSYRASIEPWLQHRRDEGLAITVVDSATDAPLVLASIRRVATASTRYVVLVGDAPAIGTACRPSRQVPIDYRPTRVTAKWGSTLTLSSDLSYGDLNGDGMPEAAVGRLPVDTLEQADRMVARILAHENSDDFGLWRSEVQLVGGVGGFGMMADAAIESVTRTVVTSVLPMDTRTNVAYASDGHPFCPTGNSFTSSVLKNYRRGARFWVYAGHGQVTELDRFPHTATGVPVLDRDSARQLNRPDGTSPIAMLLACYTGAIDAPQDSIAEEMWLTDGGPIAVIAGSRVTMPYGNSTAAMGLINGVFGQRLPRLGDAWLSALGEMHREESLDQSTSRKMIDALATIVSPAGTNLVDERREHMLLYNLIGDPMMQMQHAEPVSILVAPSYAVGEEIQVTVTSPIEGELSLSIDRPLGAVTQGDPNQTTVAKIETQATADQPTLSKFKLPISVSGPMIVRAFVAGNESWGSGAAQTILLTR